MRIVIGSQRIASIEAPQNPFAFIRLYIVTQPTPNMIIRNPRLHSFTPSTPDTIRNSQDAWERSPFPTIQSSQSLLHRLRFIMQRQSRETWLPIHLRNRVNRCCQRLFDSYKARDLTPQKAQSEIEVLASIAYQYDDLTLRSSTLCQIRALDMELNEERYRNGTNASPTPSIQSA